MPGSSDLSEQIIVVLRVSHYLMELIDHFIVICDKIRIIISADNETRPAFTNISVLFIEHIGNRECLRLEPVAGGIDICRRI